MREKYRVKIVRQAETDLAEIWTYIAADSVDNANQFILKLGEANENTRELASSLPANFRK